MNWNKLHEVELFVLLMKFYENLLLIKKSCAHKEISGSIDISLVEYVDDILVTKIIYLHM